MRLHLVRHPRVDIADGLCYGSSDVAATDDRRLCEQLLAILPRRVPLFASPLKRCAGLAEMLAPELGSTPPVYDERLAEMHFGDWEMRAWEDIRRHEVDAWAADLLHHRPGGGESVLQVARRVRAFRDDLRKLDAADVVVICHAGTIRLLCAGERGGTLEETALYAAQHPHAIAYGEVLVLECAPIGG
ncbi:MAG TPA: histidine phosphatase family protein [Oxalicibacterium sp.]|nr:histidine phosphatase family protein [Oxalicibacterium sp.]